MLAEEDITGGAFPVTQGAGWRASSRPSWVWRMGRSGCGWSSTIAVGADDPGDRIEIDADPSLSLEIPGGVRGRPGHRQHAGERRAAR